MKKSLLLSAAIYLAVAATRLAAQPIPCPDHFWPRSMVADSSAIKCGPKVIRTDPYNPFNSEFPRLRNTFNWVDSDVDPNSAQDEFCFNSDLTSMTALSAPWASVGSPSLLHFLVNNDVLPKDGWELISYDFGIAPNGIPLLDKTDHPYLVLYNRFTGILRVFCAVKRDGSTYKTVSYRLKTIKLGSVPSSPSDVYFPSNLDIANAFTDNTQGIPSIINYQASPEFISASTFVSGSFNWTYADFPIMYDPCVCNYASVWQIEVRLINDAFVDLEILLNGNINPDTTNVLNVSGSNNYYDSQSGQGTFGWEDISGPNGAVQKSTKSWHDLYKFGQDMGKVLAKTAFKAEEKSDREGDFFALISDLASSDFLKAGLKTLPYISSAVTLLDFFVAGGKSSAAPTSDAVKIMPMGIEMNGTIKGTISDTALIKAISFWTPGSDNSTGVTGNSQSLYPFYNQPLGVFHLVNTPEVKSRTSTGFFQDHYVIDSDSDPAWLGWDINFPHNHSYFNPGQPYGVDPYGHNPFNLPGSQYFTQYTFKVDNDLDFVINPLTEFKEQPELVAALFVEIVDAQGFAKGIGFVRNQTYQNLSFNMYNEGFGIYRTRYVPLAAIKGLTAEFAMAPNSQVRRVYLKVIANFERGDSYANANTQNVLWNGNFHVNVLPGPVGYDWSAPFLNVPEGLVLGSTQILTGNVVAWENIVIGSNANLSSPIPVVIRAGNAVTISPGAIIGPNITIEQAMPNGQNPYRGPMTGGTLNTFCTGSQYKTSSRKAPDTDETTIPVPPTDPENPSEPSVTFFPNPTQGLGTFEVILFQSERVSLGLYDVMGRQVGLVWSDQELNAGLSTATFNLSSLPAGLYLAVLETSQGRQTVRIVKE